MNIVSFSGGKDSTAMLLMMIERGIPIDRVICVDTTKEFPQMYEHIQKVQEMISPLEIEIVKINFDYWFGEHIKNKGSKKGEKGYGWPGIKGRWCTRVKVNTLDELKENIDDAVEFMGIAADELKRTEKKYLQNRSVRFPLAEWQITSKQALEYCYSKGLDWGGLYEKFHRVSCWCCPFSRIGSLRTLYNEFPGLWHEVETMDKKTSWEFRNDYSVQDLSERFAHENLQGKLQL